MLVDELRLEVLDSSNGFPSFVVLALVFPPFVVAPLVLALFVIPPFVLPPFVTVPFVVADLPSCNDDGKGKVSAALAF